MQTAGTYVLDDLQIEYPYVDPRTEEAFDPGGSFIRGVLVVDDYPGDVDCVLGVRDSAASDHRNVTDGTLGTRIQWPAEPILQCPRQWRPRPFQRRRELSGGKLRLRALGTPSRDP